MSKIIIAALLGAAVMAAVLILGGVVSGAYNAARRQKSDEESSITTMAQVMHLAIQKSPTGVVVVDISRDLILSNSMAHKLGLVYERRLNDVGWEAAEKVFDSQEDQELTLVLSSRRAGAPDTIVRCQLTPLSLVDDRFVVIYAADVSEQARMEAARRDFVANVSHELKTPVGAISLLVEALNEATDDPVAVRHFSESLTQESKRMSTMITELISLSKLQGAEPLPDMSPVKVEEIVQAAVRRNQMLAEQAGIEITVDCERELVVEGERSLLITAVSNLISNAINYSPEATPVSVTAVKEDNDTVAIRVTDRGIGISQANQKRIFERFFRADKARSRATGGTGLGLAIVKHVAANHKGTVKLWSRLGTGSTFTIELPLMDKTGSASNDGDVSARLPIGRTPPAGKLVAKKNAQRGTGKSRGKDKDSQNKDSKEGMK
ncbi:ATP-binding protein [Corynebacterium amycolatum]|uniref:sensor histidine kinase n=1 Tax=Corynebacterium amycolatum TaxID=43765 RepID=UPI00211A2292|nr:ATP-binding protein [Corynebacterium amycolatum]MCQ9127383.1 ATP-binding protein [Corynebacterium amycolatum]MCQ9142104.1 ATP-binding protein [Corynebacterium amycolatum]MCQ9170232.1 ATP-binding protein [Corynebacterium amycolatum]MCQ9175358.1 ATP-binding protein [Corynebacterium amycolatum]